MAATEPLGAASLRYLADMANPAPDLQPLTELLRSTLPDLRGVWCFGSMARGEARPSSDLDLAVLADRPLDTVRCFHLAQELAVRARRDVDLIDLRAASTVLRAQVVAFGELVWTNSPSLCERFADDAFSAYANLNEERAGYLVDARTRGTIRGG